MMMPGRSICVAASRTVWMVRCATLTVCVWRSFLRSAFCIQCAMSNGQVQAGGHAESTALHLKADLHLFIKLSHKSLTSCFAQGCCLRRVQPTHLVLGCLGRLRPCVVVHRPRLLVLVATQVGFGLQL